MTVKNQVIAQLVRGRKEFTGERLKVVNRAFLKLKANSSIDELLKDTTDQEVKKMIRVIHHDVTRTEEQNKVRRESRKHLSKTLQGSLAGRLLKKERSLSNRTEE